MNIKSNWSTLHFELVEEIGYLTINRESKLNALNTDLLNDLKDFLTELNKDEHFKVKGLIVTGAGEKAFIAGADILEMSEMTPSDAYTLGHLGQQVTLLFEGLKIPVIACVNGYALGGGLEMALSADFMLGTESSVYGQPEVKLGLIPGFGGTQRLLKLIGRNHAKELIYTGRNINAKEALSLGLILKIFPTKAEMLKEAAGMIKMMASNSSFAVSISKKLINEGGDLTITEGLQLEKRQFSAIFSSEDMREGTKAFLEKRKPTFKGK